MKDTEAERQRGARSTSFRTEAVALGTTMAVGMAVFAFAGHYVDSRRGGGVFWTLCGMFAGLAYGGYEVWKAVRLLDQDDRRRKDDREKRRGNAHEDGSRRDSGDQSL